MSTRTTFFKKIARTLNSWLLLFIQGDNQRGFKRSSCRLPRKAYTLADIDINVLKSCSIRGVILDLDNTIISEDDRYLSPSAEDWIRQAKLAGFKFFILSNGKRLYRIKYWSARLDIPAISPAKKPFPPAFNKAIAHMQLRPQQVVVIGDSLHTDIVGAWLSKCSSIQVATLPHPLRWWEKIGGKWIQTPYPKETKLWDFDTSQY